MSSNMCRMLGSVGVGLGVGVMTGGSTDTTVSVNGGCEVSPLPRAVVSCNRVSGFVVGSAASPDVVVPFGSGSLRESGGNH